LLYQVRGAKKINFGWGEQERVTNVLPERKTTSATAKGLNEIIAVASLS
jgi:hypothetical protein